MEGFQVTEIGEKIYCILDAGNSSFYVVEGEEKAAVIDTGITVRREDSAGDKGADGQAAAFSHHACAPGSHVSHR